MKRIAWLVIGIIVVALVAAGIVWARHNHKSSTSPSSYGSSTGDSTITMSTDANSSSTTPSSASTPTVAANAVSIKDFAYGPQNITVKAGTKVTWTNNDSVNHTVTADTSSSTVPNSQEIAPGSRFDFTFTAAGTYQYHCIIHPSMQGTVTVTP